MLKYNILEVTGWDRIYYIMITKLFLISFLLVY